MPKLGRTVAARMSHQCFMPYPDQMFSIGGVGISGQPLEQRNIIDVLNLTSLEWMNGYDPAKHENYTPHATVAAAVASRFYGDEMDPDLRNIFDQKYDFETKVMNWGPYTSTATSTTATEIPHSGKDGDNRWVVPVAATLGFVGGLAVIAGLIFCLWWKPKKRRQAGEERHSTAAGSTSTDPTWIDSWTSSVRPDHTKDVTSETMTETDENLPDPAMSERNLNFELDADSVVKTGRARWSGTTAARSPMGATGQAAHEMQGEHPPVYEVAGTSHSQSLSGRQNSDEFRTHYMHPPSVVSGGGGAARSEQSGPISQPTGSPAASGMISRPSGGDASPQAPANNAERNVNSIPEATRFSLDPAEQQAATSPGGIVSPVISDSMNRRPAHRRHNSSMSSMPSPLPSPGENATIERDGIGRRNTEVKH